MVSIIVPCYNQAQFLSSALESVIAQTYQNWECIVVNDGSTDDTESIASLWHKKDSRIKYISKINGGLSSARNTGIRSALGKYILPLDADDFIHSEYLKLAIQAFTVNDEYKLVYCKAEKFGFEEGEWVLEEYEYMKLLTHNQIFCSAIFKKSDWLNAGGYDESLKKGWEDWAFWVKMLNIDSLVYRIPKILFYYRTKPSSMIKDMHDLDQEHAKWHIYKTNIDTYQQHFKSPISFVNENKYLQEKIQDLLVSNSYTLGKNLLKPFSFMKNFFKNYTIS